MLNLFDQKKTGFTLIELMVTVAIMAILTAIVTSNFAQSKAKARDSKRITDINSMQAALEMFYDRCGRYPKEKQSSGVASIPDITDTCLSGTIKLTDFISKIPVPPVAYDYAYVVNDSLTSNNNATDYILQAKVETASAGLSDDIDAPLYIDNGVITPISSSNLAARCDNSTGVYYYCIQPR